MAQTDGTMTLQWFGHSAFKLVFDDASILIDPFLTGNPRWSGGWEGPADGITHILLTHGHDDHAGDTLAIANSTGAMVVGGFEVCQWASDGGIEAINPGNHGGAVDCGAFRVTFVNALHSSSVSTDGGPRYMGNPLGLIVRPKSDEPVVYAMGDTGIFGDMALIAELYAPTVGLVPIGDRFTMGAREAAIACRRYFDFTHVFPCHYGTFDLLDATPDAFLAEMGDKADTVVPLAVGETHSIARTG